MKEDKRKNVVIDMTNLSNPACGFGQLARNYVKLFAQIPSDKLHFTYLLPSGYKGSFGKNVTNYHVHKAINKLLPFTLPKGDIWHSVNQQQKLRYLPKGTKFIFTVHDLNFVFEKSAWKTKKYLKRMQIAIDKATAVTAISHYTAKILKENIDLKGKDVKVIYNGVERIDDSPASKPNFVKERAFFFTIGQIREKKNFQILLDVMKSFPEHDLFISGDNSFSYANVIMDRIKNENITNVFLTGKIKQEEKIWLYRNCEAFLFPSMGEGFGLPVIEAMQFGKPVFVSNYTCLPEITQGFAYVWEKLNPQLMAEEIKKEMKVFYNNKDRIENIKKHAFSFSYEKHINEYFKLYLELAQ